MRPYIPSLYKKLSRKQQLKLKEKAEKSGKRPVVIWYKNSRGQWKMPSSQLELGFVSINAERLRRGGPGLKESQVYPRGYGRQVRQLHCKHVAPCRGSTHNVA